MSLKGWLGRKRALAMMGKRTSTGSIQPISEKLQDNIDMLRSTFTQTPDLVIRTFESTFMEGRAALVYLSGLVDKNSINNNLLRPLLNPSEGGSTSILDLLSVGSVSTYVDFASIEKEI